MNVIKIDLFISFVFTHIEHTNIIILYQLSFHFDGYHKI